ncbi:MAG: YihY/virulence factor BrkB family protein [Mucilaginibacter sp.]
MRYLRKGYRHKVWKILVATFSGFNDDNGLKLSASLAYYTIFSIAPLLFLIIAIVGLFPLAKSDGLYQQIGAYIGKDAATQIHNTVISLKLSGKSNFGFIIGVISLLIGASSIFVEIQDSLNIIWRVKAKPKRGWVKLLQNRFLSFSLIISLGFLLLASLLINLVMDALSARIEQFLPAITGLLLKGINIAITAIVITTLFSIIFKFLPDVKIRWKDVRSGAFFTALLFMLGQYLIGKYIQNIAQGSVYGAAGSIIVILVWIYYTAAILYIGAEFTQVYAEAIGCKIEPAEYAVYVVQTEVEHIVKVLPAQNPEVKNDLKTESNPSSK